MTGKAGIRTAAFLLLGALGVIVEATFLPTLRVAGVIPDLLLILLCFYALEHGARRGALLGALYGLMEDAFLGRFLGLNGLIKMLVGYSVGWGNSRLNLDNPLVPIVVVWLASLGSGFLFLVLAPLADVSYPWGPSWLKVIIPSSLYNASLAFLGQSLKLEGLEWLARRRNPGS